MVEENRVTLRGMWSSMYSKRVELALRVKGIEYEYMEEDLMNKSMLLLRYNPVHKKVPVLVHNGKPVAESLVILEYIDETWKHNPRLLPEDPYERAKVGFWANFLHLQVFEALAVVFTSEGEVQERAIEQEEVFGVKFIDRDKYPIISSWVMSLTELPLVKEVIPPREKLAGIFRFIRDKALKSSAV
ncbi:hypothetical protein CDL15_Pgr008892 [Punica granatum]|uniref:Glutathione S-transferase n=1 Tax=Punica granatum TaxID=22663 RepID=A0A218VZI4_PUNGR|nr:hypothetical protein CDL15_Pgr008892 [Punica granatum]